MVKAKKMKREVLVLWEVLKRLGNEKHNLKFSYAVAKTADDIAYSS